MIKPFGTSLPKRYEKLEMVGSGGYGKVYKAKDLDSKGDIVAIKKIKLDVQSEGIPSTTMREICLLRKLSHPNIIQLKDILIEEEEISLIFDYADTDLRKELSHKGSFSEIQIKYYMKQLLLGVQFLHAHRVIHRDLKPGNLLLKGGLVKIADFGLSRYFNIPVHAYTNEVVTVWYRAPELLLGFKEYCTAIDMWSVGCIFGEFYQTEPLFTGNSEIGQIFQIFQLLGTPNEAVWPDLKKNGEHFKETFPKWKKKNLNIQFPNMSLEAVDLLSKLLEYDPTKRPSAKEALAHPYFTGI